MFVRLLCVLLIFITFPLFASPKLLPQEVTKLFQQKTNPSRQTPSGLIQQESSFHWQPLSEVQRINNDLTILTLKNNKLILFAFQKRSEGLIYKSIDAGKHWKLLTIPHVWRLYDVIALDGNRLLLAADNTIYLSTDEGEHWQLWSTSEELRIFNLFSFDGKTIFTYQIGPGIGNPYAQSGYYRSDNNGKSWIPINLGLPNLFLDNFILKANQKMLLTKNDQGDLYFSFDKGNRWQQPNIWKNHHIDYFAMDSKSNIYTIEHNKLYKTNGATFYDELKTDDNALLITLNKQDVLYLLTENAAKIKKLYRSWDEGKHWQLLYLIPPHMNIRDLSVTENNSIILTTDKDFILSDQNETNFVNIGIPPRIAMGGMSKILVLDDQFFLGTFDYSGKLYSTHDAGKTWQQVQLENPKDGILDVAIWNHQIVILTHRYPDHEVILRLSKDKTKSWVELKRFSIGRGQHLNAQHGGLFVDLGETRYFTRDLIHWNIILEEDYSVVNYFDGKTLYLSNGNWVKSSTDEGLTWKILLDQLNSSARVMRGYQHNGENGILIAMDHVGILKTTDAGLTWNLLNQELPFFFFNDLLAIDSTHYALATEVGVFYTQDAGETWRTENQGLRSISVSSLALLNQKMLACTENGIFHASFER